MKNLLFLFASLSIVSCISANKDRAPNAAKNPTQISFNLFNNQNLLKEDYDFELLKFSELKRNDIEFKKFDIEEENASKAVASWIQALKTFSAELKADVQFTHKKLPIRIKTSDFKRLDQALTLLAQSGEDQNIVLRKQVALISAFNQNFKEPLELELEILTVPFELLKRLSPYVIKEHKHNDDIQVQNSSFWADRKPEDVNMSKGPSELDLSKFNDEICKYSGPKRGFGIHQGFKAKCFDKKFKIKFGETKAAPLNSKIYHRLGYNVPAIHSLKEIKVNYERNIFTELNSGKQQYLRVKLLGQRIKSVKIKKKSDFEHYVSHAVLKSGDKVEAEEFFNKLLAKCGEGDQSSHLNEACYDQQYESEVSHVVFGNIAVVEETSDHEFGAWAFDELDYKDRAEVRALALVGAFTANHDLRKDNNKVLWLQETSEIKYAITDPGSGYGIARPFSSFNLNEFRWKVMSNQTLTHEVAGGKGGRVSQKRIVIDGYYPSADHKVFSKLNLSEARWIARKIASISEDELTEAIAASGFSAAELLLAREKMISIQKNMIEILKLENEFPDLNARQINRSISYEPVGRALEITLKNGKQISVEEGSYRLQNGELKRK